MRAFLSLPFAFLISILISSSCKGKNSAKTDKELRSDLIGIWEVDSINKYKSGVNNNFKVVPTYLNFNDKFDLVIHDDTAILEVVQYSLDFDKTFSKTDTLEEEEPIENSLYGIDLQKSEYFPTSGVFNRLIVNRLNKKELVFTHDTGDEIYTFFLIKHRNQNYTSELFDNPDEKKVKIVWSDGSVGDIDERDVQDVIASGGKLFDSTNYIPKQSISDSSEDRVELTGKTTELVEPLCEFKTDGTGKSRGLKLIFKYPCAFEKREHRDPYVVQGFANRETRQTMGLAVNKYEGNQNLDLSYLSESHLKKTVTTVSPKASYLRYTNGLKIDNLPAAYLDLQTEIAGEFNAYARYYFVLYKNYLFGVSFFVGEKEHETDKQVLKRFNSYKGSFETISRTLHFLK